MADPSTQPIPLNYENAISNCFKGPTSHSEYRHPRIHGQNSIDPRASPKSTSADGGTSQNPASGDPHLAFWIVLQAVNRFVAHEGRGYLSGREL